MPSLAANAEVKHKDNKVSVEPKFDKINKDQNYATTASTLNTRSLATPIGEDELKESKGVKRKAVIKIARLLAAKTNYFIATLKGMGWLSEEYAYKL